MAEMFAHLDCAMTALLHLEELHKESPKETHIPNLGGYDFQRALRQGLEESKFTYCSKISSFFHSETHSCWISLEILFAPTCSIMLDETATMQAYVSISTPIGLRQEFHDRGSRCSIVRSEPSSIRRPQRRVSQETKGQIRSAPIRRLVPEGRHLPFFAQIPNRHSERADESPKRSLLYLRTCDISSDKMRGRVHARNSVADSWLAGGGGPTSQSPGSPALRRG